MKGGKRERGQRTGTTPRRGVVDLGDGVHDLKQAGEVAGDDGHGVAGLLEEDGRADADDAGAAGKFKSVSGCRCGQRADGMGDRGESCSPQDGNVLLRHGGVAHDGSKAVGQDVLHNPFERHYQ